MVRFGLWEQILAEPKPMAGNLFMTGVWHYARGLAESNLGNRRAANKEHRLLTKLRKSLPADYLIGFGTAPTLLQIADLVLSGDKVEVFGGLRGRILRRSR